MKKIILTIIAACAVAFSAKAQFYVSGSVGLDLAAGNGTSATAWHLDPGFGYTFSEKSAIGLEASLGGVSSEFAWTIRPYYRFTFANVNDFHFFAEGAFNIGQTAKNLDWGVGITPGLSYTLSERFSIVTRIGYLGVKGIKYDDYSATQFRLKLLEGCRIGIQYAF